jgi:hypothetical protein
MDKNTLTKLSKEELIKIITIYQEKLAINEECKDLLRINAR